MFRNIFLSAALIFSVTVFADAHSDVGGHLHDEGGLIPRIHVHVSTTQKREGWIPATRLQHAYADGECLF